MQNRKDIAGQKYGELTAIKPFARTNRGNWQWTCMCSCGNEINVRIDSLTSGNTKSCGCLQKAAAKQTGKKNTACGTKNPQWRGHGAISGSFLYVIKRSAAQRGISFDLTLEDMWDQYEAQNGLCAYTGKKLVFPESYERDKSNTDTPSLDRIDSSKGYHKGNIQWVHKLVNKMKFDLPEDTFMLMVKAIYEHRKMGEL